MTRAHGCWWRRAVRLSVVAILFMPAMAAAEQPDQGKRLYMQYCSPCHGVAAEGNGPAANGMTPTPPDLTLLAEKAGGHFPFDDVARTIDGRTSMRGHGDGDMPVWGIVLDSDAAGESGPAISARGQIGLITAYLASIQKK